MYVHTRVDTHKHKKREKLSQHTFFERQNVPKRVRDEKEVSGGKGSESQREIENEEKRQSEEKDTESQGERTSGGRGGETD